MKNEQRPTPDVAAQEIFTERFPDARIMFLAGSVMRGEGTENSDLDLVVVYEKIPTAYRDSFLHKGWPVEVFVHDPETLKYFFYEVDRKSGIPSLPSMVLEGKEIPGSCPLSQSLKALAKTVIETGPPELSGDDLQKLRYSITDLCDDLRDPRNDHELMASAIRLYELLANFYFRAQKLWSASGKSIPRRLAAIDPKFAREFQGAFTEAFVGKDARLVMALAQKILDPYGGFLFAGSKMIAPVEWRKV